MKNIEKGSTRPVGYQTDEQRAANLEFKAAWAKRLERGTRETSYAHYTSDGPGVTKGGKRRGPQAGRS